MDTALETFPVLMLRMLVHIWEKLKLLIFYVKKQKIDI